MPTFTFKWAYSVLGFFKALWSNLVEGVGLEPTTPGLSNRYSTFQVTIIRSAFPLRLLRKYPFHLLSYPSKFGRDCRVRIDFQGRDPRALLFMLAPEINYFSCLESRSYC